jgi:hypothetical protein
VPSIPAERVLLVRAAEQDGEHTLAQAARIDAIEAAGDLDDEVVWLDRRAAYLLDHDLGVYRGLLSITRATALRPLLVLCGALLLGLASNALGPSGRVHVLYNPVALLILWNLAVYALTGLQALRRQQSRRPTPPGAPPAAGPTALSRKLSGSWDVPEVVLPPRSARAGLFARALRRLLAETWLWLHRASEDTRASGRDLARVGRRFFGLWSEVSLQAVALRTRVALHLAAIGTALGAIAGMYVRGLFFEYNVVWRSTFVQDPDSVAAILRGVLGPAALVLSQPLPDAATAARLMSPEGLPAAAWIHLYAVAALLGIVVPRALLAWRSAVRSRQSAERSDLALDQDYYRDILGHARSLRIVEVKQQIRSDVRIESEKLAAAIASFVCEDLFDRRIAPRVRAFRSEGGRLDQLEAGIAAECEGFQPELARHLAQQTEAFEASLSHAIESTVGLRLHPALAGQRVRGRAGALPASSPENVGGSLSRELANPVGAAVTTAVATVLGTVSGGFGPKVGVAVLSTLLGATGPVGFLIGAVAGLVLAGAAWWVGRGRLEQGLRQVPLPSSVLRLALRPRRLERLLSEARERCRLSVTRLLRTELDPTTDELADQIWSRLKTLTR